MSDNIKKIKKKKPTIMQKAVIDKITKQVGEGRKVSVSKAMREVGYSKYVAKNPKKITGSPIWQELMEKFLPDDFLAKKHKELLNRREIIREQDKITGEVTIIETDFLDVQAVKAGLDMGYKLKGKYTAEKVKISGSIKLKDLYEALDE